MESDISPFDHRVPVSGPPWFVGRAEELRRCREAIEAKACMSLVGEPRSGLSSLLRRLACDDFRADCEKSAGPLKFVYVDSKRFQAPLSLVRFLHSSVATRPTPSMPNWRPVFGSLVRALASMSGQRVVLLLDDFEQIGSSAGYVDFVESLRGLTQREDMSLITATHTELFRCCHSDIVASPFPNMFQVQYVELFTEQESRELLGVLSQESETDLLAHADAILFLSGPSPYYLKQAARLYYDELSSGGEPDTEGLRERFCEQVRADFDATWARLSSDERTALAAVAKDSAVSSINAGLVRRGYIAGSSVFSQAFADYVLEHAAD